MSRRKRLSRQTLLLVSFIGLLFLVYKNFGLLPGELKHIVTRTIEQNTRFRIEFSRVIYVPFEGLGLSDVTVRNTAGEMLFKARKAAVNVRILPFFREKKIIVSRLYLREPHYEHGAAAAATPIRQAPAFTQISGQIPVPTIPAQKRLDLSDLSSGPNAFLPENVYLEEVFIENGEIVIHGAAPAASETIRALNVSVGFANRPTLALQGSCELGSDRYAQVHFKGTWNLNTSRYDFFLVTKMRRLPAWVTEYQKKHFLSLAQGQVGAEIRIQSEGDSSAAFRVRANLKDAALRHGSTVYAGRMRADVVGVFDSDLKSFSRYKGSLELFGIQVHNLSAQFPVLNNVRGTIAFQPDKLSLNAITGDFKNVGFGLSGVITSFKDWLIDAEIRTDASIEDVLNILPEDKRRFMRDFEITGSCSSMTHVKGSLRAAQSLETVHSVLIHDGAIRNHERKIALTGVSGRLKIDPSGIRVDRGMFNTAKQNFSLKAFFPSRNSADGFIALNSKTFSLASQFISRTDGFHLNNSTARWDGLTARFSGRMLDLKTPLVDLAGDLEIDLHRGWHALMRLNPKLIDSGVAGHLKGPFTLSGRLNEPANWNLRADLASDKIYVKETILLDKFSTQIRFANRVLHVPYFQARPYGGSIGGELRAQMTQEGQPYQLRLYGNNVQLGLLAQDLGVKLKDLTGTAIFQLKLSGRAGDPASVQGDGALTIKDGYLFKTNLFEQMGRLPFVRVEGLDDVTFTDATGTFRIARKRIWTDDLNLRSATVHLSLKGSMDFDQNLDMLMNIQFSNDIIRGAYDTGGFVPFIVQTAERSISAYKISGSFRAPKYSKLAI